MYVRKKVRNFKNLISIEKRLNDTHPLYSEYFLNCLILL